MSDSSSNWTVAETLCNDCYLGEIILAEYLAWFSVASAVAQIAALCWIESSRAKHKSKFQWKPAFSSFNILLAVLAISGIILCLGYYYLYVAEDFDTQRICYIFSNIGGFGINTAYFLYVWGRGMPIFQSIVPMAVPWIKWYFYPYLLLQITTVVLDSAGLYVNANDPTGTLLLWGGYISVVSTFQLQIFELFVTYSYVKYLWDLKSGNTLKADKALVILSQFGLASNALGVAWLVCSMVYFFYPWNCGLSTIQNNWYIVLTGIYSAVPIVYVYLQLWMKDALRRQEATSGTAVVVHANKEAPSTGNTTNDRSLGADLSGKKHTSAIVN